MTRVPIAIFASGRGSNFEAVAASVASGQLNAEIRLVVSDQPGAAVLEKAKSRGIKAVCVEPAKGSREDAQARRLEHEKRLLKELEQVAPRFLVLAGYMRIMTPFLIEAFRSERGYARVVNVHPSLLPAFPGVSAYEQAFKYGAKTTGATVHLVEADVDSGPICAQEAFSIADCTRVSEVESRGLAVEHRLFPEALKWILPERFSVEKRPAESSSPSSLGRFCVRAN